MEIKDYTYRATYSSEKEKAENGELGNTMFNGLSYMDNIDLQHINMMARQNKQHEQLYQNKDLTSRDLWDMFKIILFAAAGIGLFFLIIYIDYMLNYT